MTNRSNEDPRIDPRIKAVMGAFDITMPQNDVASREEVLAEANSEQALQIRQLMTSFFDMLDTEEVASSKGLSVTEHTITSQPDGNSINLRVTLPDQAATLPCVYYIHGGSIQTMSCYDGNYRAWARTMAAEGVCLVMVDFRNALTPSTAEEVAPFPAGLDDCAS